MHILLFWQRYAVGKMHVLIPFSFRSAPFDASLGPSSCIAKKISWSTRRCCLSLTCWQEQEKEGKNLKSCLKFGVAKLSMIWHPHSITMATKLLSIYLCHWWQDWGVNQGVHGSLSVNIHISRICNLNTSCSSLAKAKHSKAATVWQKLAP